ncbi:MAG: branched-chain amino acid ABC transporter permease [Candidatus Bathyarchaeia archaeon]
MFPSLFFEVLIGGLVLGLLYSLVSAGLNLQYGVTRILNVAHGEFLMLGAYTTYFLFILFGVNPLISLLVSGLVSLILMLALYSGIFRIIIKRSSSVEELEMETLLTCFALSFIFQNTAVILFSANERGYIYASQLISIAGIPFALNRIIVAIASLVINFVIYAFMRFSRVGTALRAMVSEPIGAKLVGIDASRMYMLSLLLGCILSAWAGSLISMMFAITPFIGSNYLMIALVATVVGGLGSFIGGIISGIIMGYAVYITMRVISPSLTSLVLYIVLILILLLKPRGLFKR